MPLVKDWSLETEDEQDEKNMDRYRPVSHRQATQRRAEDGKNRYRRNNKEWN